MELRITGRPGKVIDKDGVVLMEMVGFPPQGLPRGLPPVPDDKRPVCLAILSKKQWRRVNKKIEKNDELLEIKGYPTYDENLKQITMLVISTKSVPQPDRGDRGGRSDRGGRPDRGGRFDRGGRPDRGDRGDRGRRY